MCWIDCRTLGGEDRYLRATSPTSGRSQINDILILMKGMQPSSNELVNWLLNYNDKVRKRQGPVAYFPLTLQPPWTDLTEYERLASAL